MAAREFSFTSFQANNPTAPPPGDRLDGEFDRLAKSLATLPPPAPVKIGKNQLEPGLFDQIGAAVAARVEALATGVRALLQEAGALAASAIAAARTASTQNAQAQDAAQRSTSEAQAAAISAAAAEQSAAQADAFYVETGNAARDTAGDVATCQAYADVTQAWAEYLPGPIPPNILAVMGISGDHWSSRFWANQAAQIFDAHHVGPQGPPGPTGATGATGAQGPPGTGSVAGMVAGQIPIAASATGIASSTASLAASFMPAYTGDVTSPAASTVNTLPTVNANVGIFQGLTVNAKGLVTAAVNQSYAPLASPVLTGDPQAPTPATADNDTSIATTAFVKAQGYATTTTVNTADGLRVLKAGDTMSGSLTINPGSLAVGGTGSVFVGAGNVYNVDVRVSVTANYLFAFVNSHNTAGDLCGFVGGGATGADTTTSLLAFTNGAVSVAQGGITRNGASAVAYGTASDARLKENIADTATGLETLMRLSVRDFNFKAEPGRTQQGLLAQELHEIYPLAVHVGDDHDPMKPWMIDYGRITPLLVRVAQQQQAHIEHLEARLTTLEAGI